MDVKPLSRAVESFRQHRLAAGGEGMEAWPQQELEGGEALARLQGALDSWRQGAPRREQVAQWLAQMVEESKFWDETRPSQPKRLPDATLIDSFDEAPATVERPAHNASEEQWIAAAAELFTDTWHDEAGRVWHVEPDRVNAHEDAERSFRVSGSI
jgi:hypothetical protein